MSIVAAWILAVAACIFTAAGHLMLKAGALASRGQHLLSVWWNPWAVCGYALFFFVTLMNLKAFQLLPLKFFVVLNALVLLLVVGGSRMIFREEVGRKAFWGMGFILAGVCIFGL